MKNLNAKHLKIYIQLNTLNPVPVLNSHLMNSIFICRNKKKHESYINNKQLNTRLENNQKIMENISVLYQS